MDEENPGLIPRDTLREVKIRECDLVETLSMNGGFPPGEEEDELDCWKVGLQMFPDSKVISNELGNTFVEVYSYYYCMIVSCFYNILCYLVSAVCINKRLRCIPLLRL